MMDRNREARRGMVPPSVNGSSGLSRRRQQRSSNLRDSPEEDGPMEFQDISGRLRDRVGKKDRDRERSVNRSKRRRGERIMHGSNRDEGGETSDDSLEDDDEEEDDDLVAPATQIRVPPPPSSMGPSTSSAPSSLPSNQLYHHHHRKSIPPSKGIRALPLLTAAGEIVVPRKARSGTASKRSHECWVSGSGAGGGSSGGVSGSGDPMNTIHRQTSTSPARHSPASTAPVSPTSTNGPPVRKKMKPMSGQKHRPPKVVKSLSSVQDIEFEVAEVLFAMTRQFQGPTKQETQKPETNGTVNDSKSRVSSPSHLTNTSQSSVLPSPNLSPIPSVVAPKRKKPRVVGNIEEGSSTNQQHHVPSSTTAKFDGEETTKMEVVSPKLVPLHTSAVAENGSASHDVSLPPKTAILTHGYRESSKAEVVSDSKFSSSEADINQSKEAVALTSCKKASDESHLDNSEKKAAADSSRVEKFKFDLMAPPSGKSSPEEEASSEYSVDRKPLLPDDMSKTTAIAKLEEERAERALKMETAESAGDVKMAEKRSVLDSESKEPLVKEERALSLHINIEKTNEDLQSSSARQQPHQKHQQSKLTKQDKGHPPLLPLPVAVGGWPGALPPIGYMGQVPSLQAAFPFDGSNGASKSMQLPHFPSPQLRTKRCATHCYIAQNIYYHQQIARMNPFWAAAPGGVPVFGAKPPYNLNSMPSPDSILLNPLQGGYPGRGIGSLPDKSGPVTSAGTAVNSSKDKIPAVDNFQDSQKRKSHGIPQGPSMHPPFIFPMNQQPTLTTAAAPRSGGVKVSGDDSSNMPPPPSNSSGSVVMASGTNSASVPTVSFNYANLPSNEAPYVTILQNNGYSFPIPAHVGTIPQYRGNHPQAMPYFGSGPFYTSQMIHPSQLPQQAHPVQSRIQNTSNSSGSTSSQKHTQQQVQRVSSAAASSGSAPHSIPHSKHKQQQSSHHHGRQLEVDAESEEIPLTVDSRGSHGQAGGAYASNFSVPLHPQDYANIMSQAAIAMGGSAGNHSDKHHPMASSQNQQGNMKVDLTQSPAFAMSFATFNGAGGAGVPPSALDFSSLVQNPMFQSLPEAARHSYQMAAAVAAAQHKNSHKSEDGKPGNGDSVNSNLLGEDERKIASAGKSPGGFSQHSLSFSRADGDAASNSIVDGSRTLSQISSAVSGSRPSSATPSTAGAATSNISLSQINQQPQQLVQFQQLRKQQQVQMQQQQHVQMQQQLVPRSKPVTSNTAGIYSDHPPSSTVVTRYPNTLSGHFPQAIIQGATPNQSSHWKSSAQPATGVPSPAKNHVSQQLMRVSQPAIPGHQMQISFTSNSPKAQQSGQPSSNPSAVSTAPQSSSVSKTTGGSPRALSATKPFQPHQQSSKNTPSGASQKSSPVTNRNTPSILGNPHGVSPAQNPSTKQHIHQQQQQVQKIHPFSQPQLYFSNTAAYLQAQTPQVNAANYFHRRPLDQQQQQLPNSTSISTSMLPLCSTSPTLTGSNASSDPSKSAAAAAANTTKGVVQPAQHAGGGAQGGQHPIMTAPGFSYIHTMPSMSVKPVDSSKSAAGGGNENVHSCWQPEKR